MANPLGDKHHHHSATQPPEVTCGHMSHRMSADANARLIAAAPMLLEVLSALSGAVASRPERKAELFDYFQSEARAAIRAAKGESNV